MTDIEVFGQSKHLFPNLYIFLSIVSEHTSHRGPSYPSKQDELFPPLVNKN